MKTRYINSGKEEFCLLYPHCDCAGHMIYEKNKEHKEHENTK